MRDFRSPLAALIVAGAALWATQDAIARELTADDVKSYYAAWSKHDVDAVAAWFTDDCVYEDVATGEIAKGKPALEAFAAKFVADNPGVTVVPQTITIGQDRVAVEWLMKGSTDGKPWTVRGAAVLEVRDGRFSRATDYWNKGA